MTETKSKITYPFMYKISRRLGDLSFYLFVIGLFGMAISFLGLLEKVYINLFVFLMFVRFHLLITTRSLIPVAVNPEDYFTPIENREKKEKVRKMIVFLSVFTLCITFFEFVRNYRGGVDFFFCVYVVMLVIDAFCGFHYVFYGNAIRKIKLY